MSDSPCFPEEEQSSTGEQHGHSCEKATDGELTAGTSQVVLTATGAVASTTVGAAATDSTRSNVGVALDESASRRYLTSPPDIIGALGCRARPIAPCFPRRDDASSVELSSHD